MPTLKDKTKELDVVIGFRVKQSRLRSGVSQEALGEHLGITFQQIQKYENGKNRIACSTLVMIADFLKVSALFLLRGTEKDAGALPQARDTASVEAVDLLSQLPPHSKAAAINTIRALHEATAGAPNAEAA
ncbi:transcriptional regulator, XRE family [Xanthobacter versatilis]|uniref:Transcriptional regulator, XRE family n=1 Tax=Xanthobacter autotrophicus (strain ATCC BAA-1158 / Py2) TaxID=78245 RepID=A7ILE3_XANP2|nr:transcriptional regulator, XRE family [Xanthobacter autotrophicus Py2]